MVYILPCAQKEVFTVKPSYFLIPQSIFNSRMLALYEYEYQLDEEIMNSFQWIG
jgi:hypothetical protein